MTRKLPTSILVSAVIHVGAIVGLGYVLAIPTRMTRWFEARPGVVQSERIGFVGLPSMVSGEDVAGRSGGDGRPVTSRPDQPRLVAPITVPTGLPTAPAAPESPIQPGSGPLVGTGGPTQGVRPAFRDPRLWREPTAIVPAPRSLRETVDQIIASDVARVSDSLAAMRPRRDPTDWTFERNGQKYGIDSRYIRLGPVSIPTAVLALLPINVQANPQSLERERAFNYMHADINYHARRAISEDEFRRNVRNLRERKERERTERGEPPVAEEEP